MARLTGRLISDEVQAFAGFRVTLSYEERTAGDGGDFTVTKSRSTWTQEDGTFAIDLDDDIEAVAEVGLAAFAPNGVLVGRRTVTADDIGDEVEFAVTAQPVVSLSGAAEPGAGLFRTLLGRVLTPDGVPAPAGLQVVLWGQAADGQPAYPLIAAATESGGYFSARWPADMLERAFGTVGPGDPVPVPVTDGRLPEQVVLVSELPATPQPHADHEDCDCETMSPPRTPTHAELVANPEAFVADLGGRCVSLTIPNRALEEVTSYAVVRTSEPAIKGFSLGDAKDLPQGVVKRLRALASESPVAPTAKPTMKPVFGLDAKTTSAALRSADTFSSAVLTDAFVASAFTRMNELIRHAAGGAPGRVGMDAHHAADWDSTPTTYQATTIAHGHLLTFRQTWYADGYSLGDLLYSLPLGPAQKKLVATVDWDRLDVAQRLASREVREHLTASMARDRDITEIVHSSLTESVRAGSEADTGAFGGGIGAFIGPVVLGGGGGTSWSSSSAWQNSARDVSGNLLQQAHDRTMQAASAARSQRSTVVQAVGQGESLRAETHVVANHNHCHAMTVQYFEVLRHFKIVNEIVAAQECLFIPLEISTFDADKALRWRDPLRRWLRRRDMRSAFDALERVRTSWVNADAPAGRYADELITYVDGDLTVEITLPRPKDTEDKRFDAAQWAPYQHLLGGRTASEVFAAYLGVVTAESRDQVWNERVAPGIARRLIESMKLELLQGASSTDVDIDVTLMSTYRPGVPLSVSLRPTTTTPSIVRSAITGVRVALVAAVPANATVVVRSGAMRYRTAHLNHALFTDRQIDDDLATGDDVVVPVRLDRMERRNPREEDVRRADSLIDHLNAHVEHYHQAIWRSMHPNRRYLLLDGFEAPNSGGRSVASVVENRLIGVVGNCLVMPVAPGVHLDPNFELDEENPGDLLSRYAVDPPPPFRVSVPTKGVFAEAAMGSCNSCEVIDESRYWRWDEHTLPDDAPAIGTVSTASRFRRMSGLRPDDFPEPLVRIQNAPDLPAATGLQAALDLIGTPNLFRDLTGIELNQRNAKEALAAAMSTAQFFGLEGAKLAQQQYLAKNNDRLLRSIRNARERNLINDGEAQQLAMEAFRGGAGARRPGAPTPLQTPAVQRAMERASQSSSGRIELANQHGSVTVRSGDTAAGAPFDFTVTPAVPLVRQNSGSTCWAAAGAMLMSWRRPQPLTPAAAMDELGGPWRQRLDADHALSTAELAGFRAALGLRESAPMSYLPHGLLRMLRQFGPLWVISDDAVANNQLNHVRIIVGIKSDGPEESAVVRVLDPAENAPVEEPFAQFARRMEAADAVAPGLGIFHF